MADGNEGDWKTITAIAGILATVCLAGARGLWWLSEQFRKARHAQNSTNTALGLEIDALERRVTSLERENEQRSGRRK